MASAAELALVVTGRDAGATNVIQNVNKEASGLGKTIGDVSKIAGGFVAANLVAGAGAKIASFLQDAGKQAAQLELQAKKALTVFGADELGDVQDWANEVARSMGLTAKQATGLAANFADLLIPMGFSREQARAMSTDVVGLSGALAEWSGGTRTSAEVSEILAKAMLGERDALKGLGISITEADVQQRLLANGQEKLTGQALEQAKAIATQQLIFEKSTDAQTAFANGQDSAARKAAELAARQAQLSETMATKLAPITLKITELKLKLIEVITTTVIPALEALYAKHWPAVSKAINDAVAFIQANWPTIQTIFAAVAEDIRIRIEGTIQVIRGIVEIVQSTIALVKAIIKGDWSTAWAELQDIATASLDILLGTIKRMLGSLPQIFLDLVGDAANAGYELGKSLANGIIRAINSFLGRLSGTELIPGLDLGPLGSTPSVKVPNLGGIPELQLGTPFVPRDMLAFLHRGEMVLPANQAADLRGREGLRPDAEEIRGGFTFNQLAPLTVINQTAERDATKQLEDLSFAFIASLRGRGVRVFG